MLTTVKYKIDYDSTTKNLTKKLRYTKTHCGIQYTLLYIRYTIKLKTQLLFFEKKDLKQLGKNFGFLTQKLLKATISQNLRIAQKKSFVQKMSAIG